MTKRILIHYHIYKNAGSSVDAMLRACFGERWGVIEGQHSTDILSRERLEQGLAVQPHLRAVSTHLGRPPVPSSGLAVVFLRHPILRAWSVYSYARLDPMQPDHAAATERGFRDYVRWALADGRSIVPIFDYQTYHLSGASFRGPYGPASAPTDDDVREAEALLRDIGVCGVVEAFDVSCAAIEAAYRPFLPELRLPGAHENRSSENSEPFGVRLTRIERELGPELYDRLLDLNALDLRLYATARRFLLTA